MRNEQAKRGLKNSPETAPCGHGSAKSVCGCNTGSCSGHDSSNSGAGRAGSGFRNRTIYGAELQLYGWEPHGGRRYGRADQPVFDGKGFLPTPVIPLAFHTYNAWAARRSYFHNGNAETLNDVVECYNARFAVGLSAQDKQDLVSFFGFAVVWLLLKIVDSALRSLRSRLGKILLRLMGCCGLEVLRRRARAAASR